MRVAVIGDIREPGLKHSIEVDPRQIAIQGHRDRHMKTNDLNEVMVVAEGDRRATINLKAGRISKVRKFPRDSKIGQTLPQKRRRY